MDGNPFIKNQATFTAESPEDDRAGQPKHNWLLTYLDVFVLMFMLVMSILAIGDIQVEQRVEQRLQQQKQEKQAQKTVSGQATLSERQQAVQQPQPNAVAQAECKPCKEQAGPTQPQTPEKTNQQASDHQLQQRMNQVVENLGLSDAVAMKVTSGYAQLEIQDKILFESSQAQLLTAGEALLQKLTPLLNKASGLIYIEGHTDNRPINTAQFPSNWELGAARAASVLHYLSSQNLDTARLRAVTYGDTQPLADNETPEGREKNRRVSIVVKVSDGIE